MEDTPSLCGKNATPSQLIDYFFPGDLGENYETWVEQQPGRYVIVAERVPVEPATGEDAERSLLPPNDKFPEELPNSVSETGNDWEKFEYVIEETFFTPELSFHQLDPALVDTIPSEDVTSGSQAPTTGSRTTGATPADPHTPPAKRRRMDSGQGEDSACYFLGPESKSPKRKARRGGARRSDDSDQLEPLIYTGPALQLGQPPTPSSSVFDY